MRDLLDMAEFYFCLVKFFSQREKWNSVKIMGTQKFCICVRENQGDVPNYDFSLWGRGSSQTETEGGRVGQWCEGLLGPRPDHAARCRAFG